MPDLPPAHEADPGKGWRRLARAGVIFYGGAALVALFLTTSMRADLQDFLGLATGRLHPDLNPPITNYFIIATSCWLPPVMLNGIVGTLVCGPAVLRPGLKRLPQLLIAGTLWFLSLLPTYWFGMFHVSRIENEEMRSLTYGLLSAYLLAGGVMMLNAKRQLGEPTVIFWLGLLPWIVGVLAWMFLLCAQLLREDMTFSSPYTLMSTLGFLGNVALLLGWLLWWRAVARYERQRAAGK